MNPKIEKLSREIEKTRVRITEAQERLRELEKQKTNLENTEIVSIYRSANITPGELAAVIRAYRDNGTIAPTHAAASVAEHGRNNSFGVAPDEEVDSDE